MDEELLSKAVDCLNTQGWVTTTYLQRKLKIDHKTSKEICEAIEDKFSDWVSTEEHPLPDNDEPFLVKWHGIPCFCQYSDKDKAYHLVLFPAEIEGHLKIEKQHCGKIKEWLRIPRKIQEQHK